jgi:hypothetical protein
VINNFILLFIETFVFYAPVYNASGTWKIFYFFIFAYFLTLSYGNGTKTLFINFIYAAIYDEISSASNRISSLISLQNLVFGNLGFDNNRFNSKIPHSLTPPPLMIPLVPLSSPTADLNAV